MDEITPEILMEAGRRFRQNIKDLSNTPEMQELLEDTPFMQRIRAESQELQAESQELRAESRITREKLIKSIERLLKHRFQADIYPYYPVLAASSVADLIDLSELVATAETLADFEAQLPEAITDLETA